MVWKICPVCKEKDKIFCKCFKGKFLNRKSPVNLKPNGDEDK